MNTHVFRFLPIVAVSLWAAGCPRVLPLEFGPEGPLKDGELVLARLEAAQHAVTSLEAEGHIRFHGPEGGGSARALIAASEEGRVQIALLDFFGKPQVVLVTDGTRLGLYQGQENRYYQGAATPQNLARLIPMVVPPQVLAERLLGRVDVLPGESSALTVDKARAAYHLSRTFAEGVQQLWIHPKHYRAVGSEVTTDGTTLGFDDFRGEGGQMFPWRLHWRQGAREIELHYSDVSLNAALDSEMFEPKPPVGVPVVNMDVPEPSTGR
ncbi:MAG: DUF4292 domain-containing protein [Myxococcaceae bacterium]